MTAEDRARQRFGWRPSRARPCPAAVVADLRCQVPYTGTCELCTPWIFGPLRRARAWLTADGVHVVTGEEWNIGRDHARMAIALAPHGLSVWAIGPGHGLVEPAASLVIIAPAGREGP
jgi:hypothetical protein